MTKREKTVWLLLCAVCVLCLAVPVRGLFLDGVYSWHIRQPEFWNMIWETAGLALILGAVWLFVDQWRMKIMVMAVLCLVFVWCHVVFLPMVVSGGYLIYVFLVGVTFRTRCIQTGAGMKDVWLWDFLLGCGAVMILFCLMSAAGTGGIGALKAAVVGTGIGVAVCGGPGEVRRLSDLAGVRDVTGRWTGLFSGNDRAAGKPERPWTKIQMLLVVFMIVMVLIQVGRMGISLDFDSLWYGVRSEYILDNGHGIYENMGSVGLVYTYPKGLEVLLLPLSDLASHSYLIFVNVWLAVMSLAVVYKIGRFYMGRTYSLLAAACVSAIPAVMNMSITAKTDNATLLVQLVMVLFFLHYLKERQARYLIGSFCAFLLSWTLKPTAVVFSTAVFGMSGLYVLGTRQLVWKASFREWLSLLVPGAALAGIWARTLIMVGIPVTSVFSSIFLKLGFQLKYPFSVLPIKGSSVEEGNIWSYLADTLYGMFLNPSGDDMSHVVIAWGTSLLLFLMAVVIAVVFVKRKSVGGKNPAMEHGCQGRPLAGDGGGKAFRTMVGYMGTSNVHLAGNPDRTQDINLARYAHTVMIPFTIVCLVSLMLLGQIDGNYFMLFDVFLVLYGCAAISQIRGDSLKRGILILILPILLLNVPVTMVSNWAWSLGYTPVDVLNKGRINHRAGQHQKMMELGNSGIWDILAADPVTRVIAVGEHPQIFAFPCNVQSYDDITSSWGNVRLVKTMDAFIEYLSYAETDYIYMQAWSVDEGSRCHELMGYLIEAGILTEVRYENGNLLAKVDLLGEYSPEAADAYEIYKTNYPVRPKQ